MKWNTFEYLYTNLSNFMLDNNILDTCDPFKLCKDKGWNVVHYEDSGQPIGELMHVSEDGFSIYDKNEYYIVYNNLDIQKIITRRINFTIAHEIGHIALFHHLFEKRKVLAQNKKNKGILERQANIFAQNILMPCEKTEELYYEKRKNINYLSDYFDVSKNMATVRVGQLGMDKRRFKQIAPLTCPTCNALRKPEGIFCNVCGSIINKERG